jgi:hypothetical protein
MSRPSCGSASCRQFPASVSKPPEKYRRKRRENYRYSAVPLLSRSSSIAFFRRRHYFIQYVGCRVASFNGFSAAFNDATIIMTHVTAINRYVFGLNILWKSWLLPVTSEPSQLSFNGDRVSDPSRTAEIGFRRNGPWRPWRPACYASLPILRVESQWRVFLPFGPSRPKILLPSFASSDCGAP